MVYFRIITFPCLYPIYNKLGNQAIYCVYLVQCQIRRPKPTPTILARFSKFPPKIAWPYNVIIDGEEAKVTEVTSPPEARKSHQG